MWARITARLARALAVLGDLIGLRSTESDVTVTVEGKWAGRFDPIRLVLTMLLVLALLFGGMCTLFTLGDDGRIVGTPTLDPYQIPTPQGPR